MEIVFSFLGEIAEVCCVNSKKAPTIKFFTSNADLVNRTVKKKRNPERMEQKSSSIEGPINQFNKKARKVLEEYKP